MALNARIGQPVGQVLMTNVAVVRLKKGGKRFEIACYKNKVQNWRNGVEDDIDEVLQIAKVYENVSKGKFAKYRDWAKVFGVTEEEQACRVILEQGELQVSQGERKAQVENMFRDIATIVADKCVNPESNRPYPFGVIERMMKEDIHYAVVPNRNAKQQALDVIKRLQGHIPIERAKMKIQITASAESVKAIKAVLLQEHAEILEETMAEPARLVLLIAPSTYRTADALVKQHTKGAGSLEVLDLSVHRAGEHSIDDEISRKTEGLGISSVPAGSKPAALIQATGNAPPAAPAPAPRKGLQCTTCGGNFESAQQHREHFRSEWHRYNLKRKASKQPPIDRDTFESLDREHIKEYFSHLQEA